MPFIHPLLLWLGVGGISIPIAIHIFNRRRFKVVDFAAMRFLMDAMRKNRRRLRVEELILLLLRCLIIFLAGAALARFAGCAAIEDLGVGTDDRTVVFLLDDSDSMRQRLGGMEGKTLFDAAKADLQARLAMLTNKDKVKLLRTSELFDREQARKTPGSPAEANPVEAKFDDLDTLKKRLADMQPARARTPLAPMLRAAQAYFRNANGTKRFYVLSDFRKVDLVQEEADTTQRQRDALEALAKKGVETLLIDYGRPARTNLTLEAIEMVSPYAVAKRPVRLLVKVRNNGTTRTDAARVQLTAIVPGAKDDAQKTIALPEVIIDFLEPGELWQHEVTFVPDTPGSTAVHVELGDDDLLGDNDASLAMQVRGAIRVLLVDGKPDSTNPERAETFFLRMALDPNRTGNHGFAVEVVTRDDLPAIRFDDYDVVYLANLSDFPENPVTDKATGKIVRYPALKLLEEYVDVGGSVVIFTGDKLNLTFYNGPLYRNGAGLNPLPIAAREGNPRDWENYATIDPKSVRPAGVMSFFSGELAFATQLIRFFAFTPAQEAGLTLAGNGESTSVVEATFTGRNESPMCISRRMGKGRVVMFYSTASLAWNDWALDAVDEVRGLYVYFMAELTDLLARGEHSRYTQPAGAPIVYPLSEALRDATATLIPPGVGADLIDLAPVETNGLTEVAYRHPRDAGIYQLELTLPGGEKTPILFARNSDPQEGRLTPASEDERIAALGEEYTYIDRSDSGDKAVADPAAKKPYWMWLTLILLGALALETYLAQRFGHWT